MGMKNPCFTGDDYIVNRQLFVAELKKDNILYFSRPVHVSLGDIDIPTSTVKISTYGIHLVECDEHTYVCPVPINSQWLFDLGFTESENLSMCKEIPGEPSGFLVLRDDGTGLQWNAEIVRSNGRIVLPIQNHVHQLQNLYASLSPGNFLTSKTKYVATF